MNYIPIVFSAIKLRIRIPESPHDAELLPRNFPKHRDHGLPQEVLARRY
jgi:hypothetical protein